MRKVYSLQDDWDTGRHNKGVIYPTEVSGTFSISFFIEGEENGKTNDEYEMKTAIYKGFGKYKEERLTLKRIKGKLYKIEYKELTVIFKARRNKYTYERKWYDTSYTGRFKGPKSPLWMLFPIDNTEKLLYNNYCMILAGHIEHDD